MKVLGIETSCDESAVCLVEASGDFPGRTGGANLKFEILGNGLASQAEKHAEFGGVFPNLAKNEHQKNLVPMLEQALKESCEHKSGAFIYESAAVKDILEREPELFERLDKFLKQYSKPDVDAIAVTVGPGLEPALWVGINFARALSLVWNIPVIAVNHMEGHIFSALLKQKGEKEFSIFNFQFPAVSLLISGGHTELVLMKEYGVYKYLGRTRDDAVGEAFDKVARMIGLPYPGGPHISRLAEEARITNQEANFKLPRPMIHEDNLDFSFSGLKTAVLRIVEAEKNPSDEFKKLIAREFENAVTETLVEKTLRAVEDNGAHTVIVGGGVSANTHIKSELKKHADNEGLQLLISPKEFATDNAVMIALAGYFHAQKKEFFEPNLLRAEGSLELGKMS